MSPELLGAIMLVLMLGAIFIGFPISFTLLLLALIFGWVGLGRSGLLHHGVPDHRNDEGGGAGRGSVIHLHGLFDGAGRAHGAPVQGLPAPDGAGAGLALRGRADHRHHLRHRRRHGGRDRGADGHHGGAHHDEGRLRHQDVRRRHYRRRHPGYPRPPQRHAGRDGAGHGRLRRRALRLVLRSRLPLGRHLHRLLPRPQPHQPAAWGHRCRPKSEAGASRRSPSS